jgi:hypothetical protein
MENQTVAAATAIIVRWICVKAMKIFRDLIEKLRSGSSGNRKTDIQKIPEPTKETEITIRTESGEEIHLKIKKNWSKDQ